MSESDLDAQRNPCWVGYISPFTIIVPDGEIPLKLTEDEINSNSYNHGRLCRIVSMLSLPELNKLKMLICYDGAFAFPKISKYNDKGFIVDFFNRLLCKLLLGGFYCEAVDTRDIVHGHLYKKRAIWPVDLGESASSHLHSKLRMRVASLLDTIELSNPNFLYLSQFHQMLEKGDQILTALPNLTPTFLIRGVTELKYRNWSSALANLWITAEQLTDKLWNDYFLKDERFHPTKKIPKRLQSLNEDNRTWSTSVKQELLFQIGVLSSEVFSQLFGARRSRNALVHQGTAVEEPAAIDLYKSILSLLCSAANTDSLPMKTIEIRSEDYFGREDVERISQPTFQSWVDYSESGPNSSTSV